MRKGIAKYAATTVFTCTFALQAYAVAPGFYTGLMLGSASANGGTQQAQTDTTPPTTTPATPKSTQFGGRIFIGYKINQYAGVEGGLTYFSDIKYDTKDVDTCNTPKVGVRDFDIVGKGSFGLGSFEIFGKAGAAVVYERTSGALNPDLTRECGLSTNEVKFRPTVSAGASYDLSQNWVADISWNRVMVGGAISSIDFYALGISYHFVDIYCGQFLCD
ncbi:outer membrane beta-barrel protein [Aquicella lusitana]|uniref:Outer membrane protein with beta-barrel domain n=1 Tax=Aquicella lusitana TaxID=254246 RepID=A0A370G600_9COXI|nr:outer membrane beta-barrel protein [Aquicella lusitana]RDI39205.1 outer membrane protein with beta-barrel domain [Aquicella lusitana]VVC74064.1 hypothetical protein AQULUS_18270 [Aquicella lusitana]